MHRDIQTFIIWKNAREYEEEILNKIKSNFTILKEYEITWTPNLFGENLSAFYGDNFIYNLFQRQVRGEGAFIFVIAEDKNPNYITVTANRGEVQVNEKAFRLKQEVRELLKTFSFHSSNDLQEARHNIALLLGKNLNDFLSSTELNGKREILHQDIPSARGWKNLSEFFYILNETCNYVLLRSYDAIPDSHTYDNNGDIDLLVDDMKKFLAILNPTIPTHKNAFHFFNWEDFGEDNKHLLIHPKFVGDNYYDINMQKKILETRKLNEKGVYIPSDEMYFWTLLHHGVFHKENWQKYDSIFKELAPKINVEYKPDKEYLCQLMTNYMKNNNYKVDWHLDNGAASLMPDNIKDDSILKKDPVFYCYNNLPYRFVVFSERAIFLEPELVTEFINQYDIFPDLERHVLDKNSNIYRYIQTRNKDGEYLWSFARRKDKFGVFSYKNKDGHKSFDKRFMPRQQILNTDYIEYREEENIKYIDCKITIADILIGSYVKDGDDAFLCELDKFISELFFIGELLETPNYVSGKYWDYLPRNVFWDNKYIFFDTEAKYIKPIKKSQCLANIILDFNNNFNFNDEKQYSIYKYFVNKYALEDIWEWSKKQREKEINEILFQYPGDKKCYDIIENILKNDAVQKTENNYYEQNFIDKNSNFLNTLALINNNLKEEQECILQRQYQTDNNENIYNKDKPLISIIIPVYNCEKYICKTLDSVISQTLKNIEIICINDGSTDGSLELLQKYAQQDTRIKIINKENGGQSSARNKGIEIAKGIYIGFVDSDDTIPDDYYQKLYENAINSNADIVQCRALLIYENNGKVEPWGVNNSILLLDSRNSNLNKLSLTYDSGFVWNKIYRKTLFDNLRFINGIYWEDNPFIMEISLKANKILSIPDTYYYYLQREGSTVYLKNAKIHFDLLKSSEYIIEYLNNPDNHITKTHYKEFIPLLIGRLNNEYERSFHNPNLTKKERNKYKKLHYRLLFKIKYLPLSEKLNYTSEKEHLKRHTDKFLKPFKILEYLQRLIKYIIGAPYYLIKEGWK